jgi:hypothetical protein
MVHERYGDRILEKIPVDGRTRVGEDSCRWRISSSEGKGEFIRQGRPFGEHLEYHPGQATFNEAEYPDVVFQHAKPFDDVGAMLYVLRPA